MVIPSIPIISAIFLLLEATDSIILIISLFTNLVAFSPIFNFLRVSSILALPSIESITFFTCICSTRLVTAWLSNGLALFMLAPRFSSQRVMLPSTLLAEAITGHTVGQNFAEYSALSSFSYNIFSIA